ARSLGLRRTLLLLLGSAILLVAAAVGGWWFLAGRYSISTDDAYVAAATAEITPRIDGTLVSVPVHDTDQVHRGEVLATIDPADAELAVREAQANLALARQRVTQYSDNVASAEAQVTARQADLARAKVDYDRRAALSATGAVSGDELTTARNALETAAALLNQARQQLAAARTLVPQGRPDDNPEIQAAAVALARAQLTLERTVIRAPIDGIVAQNTAQVGQRVQAGASLMTVAPVAQAYVNANFKESQLADIHPGQSVTLTSDLYGSAVIFHGRVVGLGGGTGSAFSMIPAQNATGNWIKVVQRLPVRIALDPNELARHPLRVGLSMDAAVQIER
ncbi:MAG: HlyD family efflux transporter periplasmic adaptor subunit, partial [Rhizomicrobium sp.]